jgi:hypothetical protein
VRRAAGRPWRGGGHRRLGLLTGLDRPGLQKIRARLDEFDVIVFFKIDRLARSTADFAEIMKITEAQLDRTKLTVDTGIALGQLGDTVAAEPLIQEALRSEATTNLRGRAFHSYWLARTQPQRRQIELACATASEALALATEVSSPRVLAHLQEFGHLLTPHHGNQRAAELSARIQEMGS